MLRLIFELFVIYILYKLIFELILPVAKTTSQIKKKMNEMQKNMQEQQYQQQEVKKSPQSGNPKQEKNEDYIDYEEVR